MAKKASVKGSGTTGKKAPAKASKAPRAPKAPKAGKAGKAVRAKASKSSGSPASARSSARQKPTKRDNAADALIGLIESPLVADLLAAAVTAAAATILEHKLKRKRETGSLVRAVGSATAAAVGRQIACEIEEIRKAAEEAKGGK